MSFDNPWGLKVKKELVELWPPLPSEEFEELKKSIAERGLLEPIVVNENSEVIEGHQRLLAWISLGKTEPPTIRKVNTGGDLAKEIALSVEYNARRRHLVKSELAIIVAKALERVEELRSSKIIPREYSTTSNTKTDLETKTITKIAEQVGISQPTLTKAMKVVEKGTPEVKQAVEKGELSVKRAYEIVQHPPEEQKKLLQEPQPQPRRIDKSKWTQVYSGLAGNPSVEGVNAIAARLGVAADEVIRVVNLVRAERGELPISLAALAQKTQAQTSSQSKLSAISGTVATTPTTTHTTTATTTSTIRKKEEEEEDVIVLSDPYVVAGVHAYARTQRIPLEEAASKIIVEHLIQLGIVW